ncbi:hypothetical protein E6P09_06910 [Haloferax mediterranei ATCC 33500]|uniref:DUF7979 domain-containing protein n=1 Tax=Haloferax mediterranei (strain ATCC 33500 / DSM 1411 / JCM 8866 / NBRC 14739 / NCIMB 2177 / R-4) TaxID=523841 RepID=I3R2N9_HALMT|nr:hypothetical protein [Haloferax mediterranei]AFK18499.1 hypothetical protein HFX_0776 [Haloferax mediterranei ATCC 33500]AHZ22121.1 hypothetical protein BM92_05360 [Haloferax mediterranei ATCC 33500]EMA02228.1 hypothetical protein C439_06595 [Haloferax mediterranei ATCC 33500]MDX5988587.1 hypothetical protein [Haloferax mediterranei ATCC 33500]QCQ75003.1 hypothetical protein E6P09_06910 [Haloferax mediterranei ATCC 33500]
MRFGVVLAVALVVLSTGCLGGSNGTGYLTVERVDELPQGEGAVSYENLSSAQQEVFQQALDEDGSVTLEKGIDRNEFIDPGYVRYDGDVYRTSVAVP